MLNRKTAGREEKSIVKVFCSKLSFKIVELYSISSKYETMIQSNCCISSNFCNMYYFGNQQNISAIKHLASFFQCSIHSKFDTYLPLIFPLLHINCPFTFCIHLIIQSLTCRISESYFSNNLQISPNRCSEFCVTRVSISVNSLL